jgi:sporulation protein YlmC with PRC-barrel domain
MNFTYLDNEFQTDSRAVMLYGIKDYDSPIFIEVGTVVTVLDIMVDPNFRSGYSVIIKLKNSDTTAIVDKDVIMPYKDFKKVKEAVLVQALNQARYDI